MKFDSLLDKFQNISALVVGDLMLDEYIHGKATRISPEAPVMVVRHDRTTRVPGGAANVAKNLIALGAQTSVLGVVGNDEAGALLSKALEPLGLQHSQLVIEKGRATTRKTRVLADSAHQVLRIDSEDEAAIQADTVRTLIEHAIKILRNVDVLVLSDYLKGVLSHELVTRLIQEAKSLNKTVVANPKPRSVESYAGASLISLNRKEAGEALGMWQGLSDNNAEIAATNLAEKLGSPILVTLGDSGMVAASGKRICRSTAPKVEVYDTAGAGDTVIATVALGMATFGFEKTIFELAAQTSACVVRRIGVAVPTSDDLTMIRSL